MIQHHTTSPQAHINALNPHIYGYTFEERRKRIYNHGVNIELLSYNFTERLDDRQLYTRAMHSGWLMSIINVVDTPSVELGTMLLVWFGDIHVGVTPLDFVCHFLASKVWRGVPNVRWWWWWW